MCPTGGRLLKIVGNRAVHPTPGTIRGEPRVRRTGSALLACLVAVLLLGTAGSASAASRTLELYFTHTKESIKVVYKRNGRYVPSGLRDLNRFLRDWRRNESTKMDPELFDLLWEVQQEFGGRIHVVSAYRSPATNSMLRRRSRGVAKNSQHMAGKAVDFYIKGANIAKLRREGMRRQVGGVGYYPRSNTPFVHFDTGRVRSWPRMSRGELAKLFPDGKTLHLPSNGKALNGYQQAMALEKAGKLTNLRGGGDGGGSLFGFLGRGGSGGSGGGDDREVRSASLRNNVSANRRAPAARTPAVTRTAPQPSRPKEPEAEPVRVRTASLGPTATGDEPTGRGLFRQLPSVSLGGLIGRLKNDDAPGEPATVETVAPPATPLTAVAVETAREAPVAEAADVLQAAADAPVPRQAPRAVAALADAPDAPGEAAEAGAPDAPATLEEVIDEASVETVVAALPPQRPADLLDPVGALAYARTDAIGDAIASDGSPLNAAAALIPRSTVTEPLPSDGFALPTGNRRTPAASAELGEVFSPVRGASPVLIADTRGIEETAFSDLTPRDTSKAASGGLLLAQGFLGAPSGFAAANEWPSTEGFSGLRITVYAKPRS